MLFVREYPKIINKTQLRLIKSRRISWATKTKQKGKK